MDGSILPRHIADRAERRLRQQLEAQVLAWKSAERSDQRSTDRGVQVVRRRKRLKPLDVKRLCLGSSRI
jgi:hypothetical protein